MDIQLVCNNPIFEINKALESEWVSCDVSFHFFKWSSKVLQRLGTCRCHSMKPECIWANIVNVGQSYFCKCLRVKRRNSGVLFQFREVSWEVAATVETAIYFWHLTLKLTLWRCQRPHGADPAAAVSLDFLSGIMDVLYNTDWGSRDTVSALMDFVWAHRWCLYVPESYFVVLGRATTGHAGVTSKSQFTNYWSAYEKRVLIFSSGINQGLRSISVFSNCI